ncbi:uncharacterized protein TrAFT101_007621 [Trichoderma asperellum]|uniref:uncharacterized protein n=1 Tax=Trichoderma asperellum TaxID=101201 RepID=UPI00332C40A8|nr:hypothetical protein TrAFT101_007621 [Trichoderma asperellum]
MRDPVGDHGDAKNASVLQAAGQTRRADILQLSLSFLPLRTSGLSDWLMDWTGS